MISLASVYHNEIPSFLNPYLKSPSLERLKNVDMNCGMSFTSFPRFSCVQPYSRFHHSLGTALIVWHFTQSREQTLAALFHDISTPAFSHVIDFLHGDHMSQESTENKTEEFILKDPLIMAQLEKDGIGVKAVSDYHMYPIADNDSPRLSADRLEYTCGNIISYEFGSEDDLKRLYGDLRVGVNEEGIEELVFTHQEYAAEFAQLALKCGKIYSCDEDRYGMEYLARLIQEGIRLGILSEEDLYTGDQEVMARLEHSPLKKKTDFCRQLFMTKRTDASDPEGFIIYTKKRYIDPLGPHARASASDHSFRQTKEAFMALDYGYRLKGVSMSETKTIVVASSNEGKIREFRQMLEPRGYMVKSLADFPDMPEIDETGTTFSENAVIKAKAVTDRYGITAVSDDSGLEIDAFDKKPGVMSARWLGHDTPYSEKNRIILEKMQGIENRTCRYVCAIAITRPDEEPVVFEETVECTIAYEPSGENGFGYDPIIYYPPFGKTMADMDKDEKNSISHRGKAVRLMEAWLEENGNA